MIYHVLNRGNGRMRLFHKDADFAALQEVLAEGLERYPVDLLTYCLMSWIAPARGGQVAAATRCGEPGRTQPLASAPQRGKLPGCCGVARRRVSCSSSDGSMSPRCDATTSTPTPAVVDTWRQRYEANLLELEPHLGTLASGGARLSPILTAGETGAILQVLWRDWRRVEKRYFAICEQCAFEETGDILDWLIEHMLNSARTLLGLLEFFPRFTG